MDRTRRILAGWALAAGLLAFATPTASAQAGIGGRSLGGYGGATIGQYYGGGSTTFLPYNGGGGWVPYRGGYSGGFTAGPVERRPPRTPIVGLSMPMTPIGGSSGRVGMIGVPMTGPVGPRRSPLGPGFRYPFATPPSLAGPSGGMGPSM